MAKVNVAPIHPKTHEGGRAAIISPEQELRRSVMACMLWEKTFYEEGQDIAARIADLAQRVPLDAVAAMAVEAREKMHLRHVPLWLSLAMVRRKAKSRVVSQTITRVIQRADELTELLAMYWKDGKTPIAHSLQRGLAEAFPKFGAYALAKYNRDEAIKLRDVMFLTHPKPKDEEQAAVWKQLAEGTLPTPDTWEVRLSTGKDKKESFETLLREGHLGYLALLRNLRNMVQAGVDRALISDALHTGAGRAKVLPFRFIAAAKAVPELEEAIDAAFLTSLSQQPKLPGKTLLVIDVSGSMYGAAISEKSDMNRALAACALGAIMRERCEEAIIYATAGNDGTRIHQTQLVPARRGMALVDAIYALTRPLGGGGIFLTPVCRWLAEREKDIDRMIVITDEQDCAISAVDAATHAIPLGKKGHNFLINVNTYEPGIGYRVWTHINGFSEAIVDYIMASEV